MVKLLLLLLLSIATSNSDSSYNDAPDDEVPDCVTANCGSQIIACVQQDACADAVEQVVEQCYTNNENPMQCMDDLVKESQGQKSLELCNNDQTCAGDLQALGDCVINSANYGFCTEEEYKKIKGKVLIKTLKKVRERKLESKEKRTRSERRARSNKLQRDRKLRQRRVSARNSRSKVRGRRGARSQLSQQRRTRQRRSRRKLQSASDSSCCDCTNTEPDAGCSANPECEAIVCPLDSYCCNNNWDGICANGANNICLAKDYWSWESTPSSFAEDSYDSFNTGTTGSCCECTEIGDGPGCNAVCDNEVCGLDPYCCNNYWDGICANGASNICQGYEYWNYGGTPYYGSSYTENPAGEVEGSCCDCQDSKSYPTPFCNTECDKEICPLDSYCCNTSWDWICANSAKDICAADEANANQEESTAGGDGEGGCCGCTDSKNTPFCNDVCDSEICPLDPYCCNNQWDGICANSANQICEGQQEFNQEEGTSSSSYTETNTPSDSSCCDCTNTESDSGCSANPECEQIVCPLDSWCCNVNWDSICANGANNICLAKDYWLWESTPATFTEDSYDSYNTGTTGSCCGCTEVGDGPGCNAVCDTEVCGLDPFCCNNYWDGICANGASNICSGYEYWNSAGTSSAYGSGYNENPAGQIDGTCCDCQNDKPYGNPYCNTECDAEICPLDNYCCNNSWDWICANAAADICAADSANANEGSEGCCGCTDSKSEPFCNEVCDSEICPLDPYCCNVKWDGICANSANQICEGQQELSSSSSSYTPSDSSCCDCTNTEPDAGCSANPECESIVCPLDSYCCNNNWDGICANGANNICLAKDYWSWESTPASFAEDSYDSYNTGTTGSCCDCTQTGSGPGCNAVCDDEVCGLDPYCCNNYWDGICANGANNICSGYEFWGGSAVYSSYEPVSYSSDYGYSGSYYDPYSSSSYDSWYSDSYSSDYGYSSSYDQSGSCCDCTNSKSEANCNGQCDSEICSFDPYCCNVEWDWICANAAKEICENNADYNEYEDIDCQCVIDNCFQELTTCAENCECVVAAEKIGTECEKTEASMEETKQCFEEILINDDQQQKLSKFCDDDNLCTESISDIGQCFINNGCFEQCSDDNKYSLAKATKSAEKSLKNKKLNHLKKRKKAKALREKQLKSKSRRAKSKASKKAEKIRFGQQLNKFVKKKGARKTKA